MERQVLRRSIWGWLPVLTVSAAFGVLVAAMAMIASINGSPYAMLMFWFGIICIVLPVVLRLLNPGIQYAEALALVILVGAALFLVSTIRSSNQNSSFDAFLHYRTAVDILESRHLFTPNPMLPVSPYYPGLEVVSTALVNMTGLPVFQAGSLVVFAARWIMTSSLFMIFFMLSGSARAAGIGTLVYMGSTTFVFFDTQFAYESLSLPLTVFVFWLILKRSFTLPANPTWILLAILVGITVAVTHHIMSYFMAGMLLLWTGVAFIRRLRGIYEYNPVWPTIVLVAFILAWLLLVADITVGYLDPYLRGTQASLIRLISGYQGDRSVFSVNQSGSEISERLASLISVALLMIGLGMGLVTYWKTFPHSGRLQGILAQALVITSLLYPLLPLLRLNGNTWEVSNRLSGVVFLGLGFVIGLGVSRTGTKPASNLWQRRLVAPAIALVVVAGIIGGTHPATRLPGAYVVEADGRSFDSYSLSAAYWAEDFLGPDNRMAGDREQSLLMGSLGRQTMVFGGSQASISPIFLKPALQASELQVIRKLQIHYLVVDMRITQGAPLYGYYFENWEQKVAPTKIPLDPAALQKFDFLPNVSRIYDNGNIRVYDIRGLANVP